MEFLESFTASLCRMQFAVQRVRYRVNFLASPSLSNINHQWFMSGYLKNFCSSLATEKTSGLLPLLLMYYTSPVMFTGRNNSNTATHLLDLTEVWRWPSWHCSSMYIWKETLYRVKGCFKPSIPDTPLRFCLLHYRVLMRVKQPVSTFTWSNEQTGFLLMPCQCCILHTSAVPFERWSGWYSIKEHHLSRPPPGPWHLCSCTRAWCWARRVFLEAEYLLQFLRNRGMGNPYCLGLLTVYLTAQRSSSST